MTFWVTAPLQGLPDISGSQKYETDKNPSAKVIPGTQREIVGDIHAWMWAGMDQLNFSLLILNP